MNLLYLLLTVICTIVAIAAIYFYLRKSRDYKVLYIKFKDVIDIEKEIQAIESKLKIKVAESNERELEINAQFAELKKNYESKKAIYDNLQAELSVIEEDLEFISYGVYKPHFDLGASEKYKEKLWQIRELQKQEISKKSAAICPIEWTVDGSQVKGRQMTNRTVKLVLRAFNNECDSAVLKVKWNNALKMEVRIQKAYDALNKLTEPNHIEITRNYLQLKLDELHVAHEYEEKLYQEKEEQRQIREQIREEEKVRIEIEKATEEADEEEKRYQKALLGAKSEIESAHGAELEKLNEQIRALEDKLKAAQEMKERALSRAQQTKSGHVYIISNIGSLGEDVYKIGMTRRLEPEERVRELGDASVPFGFDVHGMIYSENAPDLEAKLHAGLNDRRINLVNSRKEFFSVSLSKIEEIIKDHNLKIELTKIVEAKEYRESRAIREQNELVREEKNEVESKFPVSL